MVVCSVELPPLILQPYVENAIWHGLMHREGSGQVKLALSRENGYLRCVITDDGIGRLKAAELQSRKRTKKRSMGMNITQDRINTINNLYETNTSVQIIDLFDGEGNATGTKVELSIPI